MKKILPLLALSPFLAGCFTQYSPVHEVFLRKLECEKFGQEIHQQAEEQNANGGDFLWFGGKVFYSSKLNTCISMGGYAFLGEYTPEAAKAWPKRSTIYTDVLSQEDIKIIDSFDYQDEKGVVDFTAYNIALQSAETALGIETHNPYEN